jgi:hypothetical protein
VSEEIIERAARAAYEQFYNSGWPPKSFDAELRTADEWRNAMRAVILTLREPTESMAEAGDAAGVDYDSDDRTGSLFVRSVDLKKAWQAAIDEAAR